MNSGVVEAVGAEAEDGAGAGAENEAGALGCPKPPPEPSVPAGCSFSFSLVSVVTGIWLAGGPPKEGRPPEPPDGLSATLVVGAGAAEALGFSEPNSGKPVEVGNENDAVGGGADLGPCAENPKLAGAELVVLGSDEKGAVGAGTAVEPVEILVEVVAVEVSTFVLDAVVDVFKAAVAGKLTEGLIAASLGFSMLSLGFSSAPFLSPNSDKDPPALVGPKPKEVVDGAGVVSAFLLESFDASGTAWVLPMPNRLLDVDDVLALVDPRLGVGAPKEDGVTERFDDVETEVAGADADALAAVETSACTVDGGLPNGKEADPLSFFSSSALPDTLDPPAEN